MDGWMLDVDYTQTTDVITYVAYRVAMTDLLHGIRLAQML